MKKLSFILGILICIVFSACNADRHGNVNLDQLPDDTDTTSVAAQYTYKHPCAMWNQADFDRVKATIASGNVAVNEEFANLKANRYAQKSYTASPTVEIVRGDATGTIGGVENYSAAMRDASAAYQLALLWNLTGDDEYAAASMRILNAWASVCKRVTSNDANHLLAAGVQGYTFACAAEMLLGYSEWTVVDKANFKQWMLDVFAPRNKVRIDQADPNTCPDHYWSNWDLVNMCSYLAIGILCEKDEMVNYIVNYFYKGIGNGALSKLAYGQPHTDPMGTGQIMYQNQESGRDQGHATMSTIVAANLAQIAYTLYQCNTNVPQLDFFAAEDNKLLKMAEYVALFNLKNGDDKTVTDGKWATGTWAVAAVNMPFTQYVYCIGCSCRNTTHGSTQTVVADDSSRGSLRPGWEIFYNHYAKVKGLSSGYLYTERFANRLRPEGGTGDSRYGSNSGAFDQLGWGTLMMYRD